MQNEIHSHTEKINEQNQETVETTTESNFVVVLVRETSTVPRKPEAFCSFLPSHFFVLIAVN